MFKSLLATGGVGVCGQLCVCLHTFCVHLSVHVSIAGPAQTSPACPKTRLEQPFEHGNHYVFLMYGRRYSEQMLNSKQVRIFISAFNFFETFTIYFFATFCVIFKQRCIQNSELFSFTASCGLISNLLSKIFMKSVGFLSLAQ